MIWGVRIGCIVVSSWGCLIRILNRNLQEELLWGLWVGLQRRRSLRHDAGAAAPCFVLPSPPLPYTSSCALRGRNETLNYSWAKEHAVIRQRGKWTCVDPGRGNLHLKN